MIIYTALTTPFPILSQSVVPCPVLTVASWPAYRFLRRQNSLWSTQSKALASQWSRNRCFFLELSCFVFDPTDVGNSISVSSAFSKFSLNIWKFLVHILLNPGLENFEHYFARVWNECNCVVVWTFLTLPFFGMGMKTTFSSPVATAEFSKFAGILSCSTFFFFIFYFFPFIFISWRLITLQYCSGFCHTLTWISHGFTCIPHPDPPSLLPPHPIPLGLPSAPARSTCLMHPTWAGDLFHPW